MNKFYKYVLYIIGAIIVTFLGVIFPQYTVPISAFWPFGYSFIAILLIADMSVEIWRAKSSHVLSNVGHYSICGKKDIHHIPWHNEYITITDEKNQSLGNMTIMLVGGIDYIANIKSSSEYPVFIFPSIYEEQEESCYHVLANLQKYTFKQLSPYLQYVLSRFKRRITSKTPIYYGITSHMNATAIPQNIRIEMKEKKDNELLSAYIKINEKLYDQVDKQDKRKTKNIFVREKGDIEEE